MKPVYNCLFIFASLFSLPAVAQNPPTQEEIQAILERTKRMVDSVGKMQKSKLSSMSNNAEVKHIASLSKPDTTSFRPPPRNAGILGALPQKNLSSNELRTFITTIDKRLTAILINEGVQLPPADQADAGTLCQASLMELLQGGSKKTGWLAIKAIEKSPDNVVLMNDCGAILNGCGMQPVAIPVLETALQKSPGNSSIQNNLGQAYVALGEVDKATMYLQQCIKKSPEHPHANFSLACIYHSKGDDASALNYCENSLRGSFSDGAWHLLNKLKKDPSVLDYIKDRYQPGVYFDEDKYHLPQQCERVEDVPAKKAEYTAYHQSIVNAQKQMNAEADNEMAQGEKELQDASRNYKPGDKFASPVFNQLAGQVFLAIDKKLTDDYMPEMAKQEKIFIHDFGELAKEHDQKSKGLDCRAQTSLDNNTLEKMAIVTRTYQKAYLRPYVDFYNESMFWYRIYSTNQHTQRASLLRKASGLLGRLSQLAITMLEYNGCNQAPDIKKDTQSMVIPPPDCGIDISFKCVVGSFHIDCEKISFSTKAGLLLDIDHSFANHRTTIMIGAGEDLKFGKRSVGNIEGEFSTAGYMKFFVNFDATRPSDLGFKWKTSISYTQEITNGFGFKPIETANVDLTSETTLSVANGWTFKGSLYDKIDQLMGWNPSERK
jgi:tetratricopeptide (TPR) repeat protein